MSSVYGSKSFGNKIVEACSTFSTVNNTARGVFEIDVDGATDVWAEFTALAQDSVHRELHRVVRQLKLVSPIVVTDVFDTDSLITSSYNFNTGVTGSGPFTFNVVGATSRTTTWCVSVKVFGGDNVTISVL